MKAVGVKVMFDTALAPRCIVSLMWSLIYSCYLIWFSFVKTWCSSLDFIFEWVCVSMIPRVIWLIVTLTLIQTLILTLTLTLTLTPTLALTLSQALTLALLMTCYWRMDGLTYSLPPDVPLPPMYTWSLFTTAQSMFYHCLKMGMKTIPVFVIRDIIQIYHLSDWRVFFWNVFYFNNADPQLL